MVAGARGVDAPVSRQEIQRQAEAFASQVPLFSRPRAVTSGRLQRRGARTASRHSPVHAGAPGDAFYVILDGEAA